MLQFGDKKCTEGEFLRELRLLTGDNYFIKKEPSKVPTDNKRIICHLCTYWENNTSGYIELCSSFEDDFSLVCSRYLRILKSGVCGQELEIALSHLYDEIEKQPEV